MTRQTGPRATSTTRTRTSPKNAVRILRRLKTIRQPAGFRQKRNPSLQVVHLAANGGLPHDAEFDIDLGDLFSLPGFIVHTAEVLMPGRTDHIRLWKRLKPRPEGPRTPVSRVV